MKKIISTKKAPGTVGPYSQAVEVNGTLYISGQVPIDPDTGKLTGDTITEQTEQVLKNIRFVVNAAGYSMKEIVTDLIFDRHDRGMTILLIEHDIQAVMELSHSVIVLDYGKKIAEGTPDEIAHNELVTQAYLGGWTSSSGV